MKRVELEFRGREMNGGCPENCYIKIGACPASFLVKLRVASGSRSVHSPNGTIVLFRTGHGLDKILKQHNLSKTTIQTIRERVMSTLASVLSESRFLQSPTGKQKSNKKSS